MASGNLSPEEVKSISYNLEISPSCHSPGDLHKQGEMPKSIGGKSAAMGHEGAEAPFKAGPNYKQGKTSGGSKKGR